MQNTGTCCPSPSCQMWVGLEPCNLGIQGLLPSTIVVVITMTLYSEKIWAVGIAQLTHHEVRGGGKNPETGGRGIFAPTADLVGSLLRNTDRPCRFAFIPHFIFVTICIFLSLTIKTKRILRRTSTQLNLSLWWRHNIYLWRHNGARRHARAKQHEYFMLENCAQTTLVCWSKYPIELLYIYIWWNYLRLNRTQFFKLSYISKISMFTYQ